MAFTDSNRTGIRWIEEATWGDTPAGPVMTALNLTSESLKSNINTVTSETIRSDRNVSDRTVVGGGASGDLGWELRYGDIEELFAGAMGAAWVSTIVSVSHSAYVSGANLFVGNGSAATALASGMFLRISNASNTAANGDYRVTDVVNTGGSSVVTLADASSGSAAAFASDIFAATTKVQANNIRNGTTKKSYTIEKAFLDNELFHRYAGMRVTALNFDLTSQSILTGSFGFTGKSQVVASTTVASGTVTAASTNNVMNASGNVGRLWEGGQAVTGTVFQALSLSLNNNPREQTQVGSDQLAGVGLGQCDITGAFTAYFEDNALITKFVDNTDTSIRWQVDDTDGNSYIVDVPKVRLMDQTIVANGPNDDVMQDVSWGGIVDTTGTYAIQITALDA